MPLSNAAKNVMLDTLAGVAVYVSLHTADPGDTGANEAAGGVPAYARKAITWSPASGGSLNAGNQPVFDVPAGTFTHFGLWDSMTAGTFHGGGLLPSPETFGAQGTYTLLSANVRF